MEPALDDLADLIGKICGHPFIRIHVEKPIAGREFGQTIPLTLCYPHASLEALMPRLSATAWYSQPDRSTDAGAGRVELAATLRNVGIPITAVLGSVELSVEALVGLRPGDTIRLEERADAPVLLSVMDQARAWAQPGRVGDRLALRVVSALEKVEA